MLSPLLIFILFLGLQNQKFNLSWSRRLKVQNPGVGWTTFPPEALGENPSLTGFWCWQPSSAAALCSLFIWPFPPGVCVHLCVSFNQTFVIGFRAYPDNSECSHLKALGLVTSAKNPLPSKFTLAGSGGHHSPQGTHSPHSFNGQEVGAGRRVEAQLTSFCPVFSWSAPPAPFF